MKPTILAIADSDSYLKLAVTFLDRLPDEWQRRVALVRSPVMPTEAQILAAFTGTSLKVSELEFLTLNQLNAESVSEDVLFAAATGPVVAEAFARLLRTEPAGARRTALISALPGVAYPATQKGWNYRRAADAFICHSHAEARDFSLMTEQQAGHQPLLMVGKLPFLHSPGFPPEPQGAIRRIVFAPQAKVPVLREHRESILMALDRTVRMNPGVEVVVKLRARAGEPQTHLEQYPYDELYRSLRAAGSIGPHEYLRFETGSMADVLTPHSALITVSSTAALEAMDLGLPTMIISDFGLNAPMINAVFQSSGIVGTLDDVIALNFGRPTKAWLRENYFHRTDSSLVDSLARLAHKARHGLLETDPEILAFTKRQPLRQKLRTALPSPIVKILVKLRRQFTSSSSGTPQRSS